MTIIILLCIIKWTSFFFEEKSLVNNETSSPSKAVRVSQQSPLHDARTRAPCPRETETNKNGIFSRRTTRVKRSQEVIGTVSRIDNSAYSSNSRVDVFTIYNSVFSVVQQ